MKIYQCSEDGKYWIDTKAHNACSAAEYYAEKVWWDSGCERPNRIVKVMAVDEEETIWEVEGESTMNFYATRMKKQC